MTVPPASPSPCWRGVMIGSDRLLIECATQWRDHGHDLVAIVCDKPDIARWATLAGIKVVDKATLLPAAGLPPFDYLFDLDNPAATPPPAMALPRLAAIHLHNGLLPGPATFDAPVRALLNRERRHGICWHLLTPMTADGDLLLTRGFDLDEDDSALSVRAKCFVAARGSFAALLAGLAAGGALPRPHNGATHDGHRLNARPAAAGMIDWQADAHDIAHLVRALDHGAQANHVAAAKISIDGHVLLVGTASVLGKRSGLAAGTLLAVRSGGMVVATATCDLRIGRITTCSGMASDLAKAGCVPGAMLNRLSTPQRQALSVLSADVAHFEPWWRHRLARRRPLRLPQVPCEAAHGGALTDHVDLANLCPEGPRAAADRTVLAALVAWLGRIAAPGNGDQARFDLGYADPLLLAPSAVSSRGSPPAFPWMWRFIPSAACPPCARRWARTSASCGARSAMPPIFSGGPRRCAAREAMTLPASRWSSRSSTI